MASPLRKLEAEFGIDARFSELGRSTIPLVRVTASRALEICSWARMEESLRLDFLESFSMTEHDGELALTWFVRSLSIGHELAIRVSLPAPEEGQWLELPSMVPVWTQAEPFENELSPLFGVRFAGARQGSSVLRELGTGTTFPLRKSFLGSGEAQP